MAGCHPPLAVAGIYKRAHPDGYQYTEFCGYYRSWRAARSRLTVRLRGGGQGICRLRSWFVDYAGQTIPVLDPTTSEVRHAQIFIGILGASHYLYAERTWTQRPPDWIAAHGRMHEAFGGLPGPTALGCQTTGFRINPEPPKAATTQQVIAVLQMDKRTCRP